MFYNRDTREEGELAMTILQENIELKRIARALERLLQFLDEEKRIAIQTKLNQKMNLSMETKLFQRIVAVYQKEEIIKREHALKRKSSCRLSKQIQMVFLRFLIEHSQVIEFELDGGFIIGKKAGKVLLVIKLFPHLGGYRGKAWYKIIDKVAREACKQYQIDRGQVYLFVSSLVNSIDVRNVKELTGKSYRSSSDILAIQHRSTLYEYLKLYMGRITGLKEPDKQIYFLSAGIHPNLLSLQVKADDSDLIVKEQEWLKPSIAELIHVIEKKK
ncbi:hypothetical protein [Brevibacillus laterosporus]|uniref:hypothetical protein n=1 Tax=Brevibacillus laterosporus TaxID=1465 RepID=UPI002156FC02|nr:hypothetical protein [Brevibacillus laterosporus]